MRARAALSARAAPASGDAAPIPDALAEAATAAYAAAHAVSVADLDEEGDAHGIAAVRAALAARFPRPETARDDADEREADLYARLSQQWYAERAAGIPRGSLIAAESVTCNYLMNYDEKNGDLTSLARAIVAEIAGALVTLPGEGAAARSPREESAPQAKERPCPVCEQQVPVRSDGRLMSHSFDGTPICPGSRVPASAETTEETTRD